MGRTRIDPVSPVSMIPPHSCGIWLPLGGWARDTSRQSSRPLVARLARPLLSSSQQQNQTAATESQHKGNTEANQEQHNKHSNTMVTQSENWSQHMGNKGSRRSTMRTMRPTGGLQKGWQTQGQGRVQHKGNTGGETEGPMDSKQQQQ